MLLVASEFIEGAKQTASLLALEPVWIGNAAYSISGGVQILCMFEA